MILLLRGHIRQSFENRELYKLIQELNKISPLKIYIHTWSKYANSLSWRNVMENNNTVTEDTIYEYFSDLKHLIIKVQIDDDNEISLNGNVEGNVGKSRMPLKGWKNYWYGQMMAINTIIKVVDPYQLILNTRFDVLCNSVPVSIENIKSFIHTHLYKRFSRNVFLKPVVGIDNVMLGTPETMYNLIRVFHLYLDEIILKETSFIHHEQLVSIMNHHLFKNNFKTIRFI
jgi:hypothetical protein